MKSLALLLLYFLFSLSLFAQTASSPSPILFIYDASGSMWGKLQGKTKMQIASQVLSNSIEKLPDNQNIGLVAYGHRKEGDCQDVEFLVDIADGTKSRVDQSLKTIKPLGKTPLAYSARQVFDRLRATQMKATVILITDGIESCEGNICEVVKAAKKEGIDFKLHIVGFGLKAGETEQLRCAAKAGDGRYFDAADAGGLGDVLNEAIAASVDKPVENMSLYALKNDKPIDAYIVAYRAGTKSKAGIARTYADTALMFLPQGVYDFEATPIRGDILPVTLSRIQSFKDQINHQTINFDGGKIEVSTTNNGEGWDAMVRVYTYSDKKPVAAARTYGKPRTFDLSPGVYDIEVQALVIEGSSISHKLENIEIKAGEEAKRSHEFKTGTALIGAKSSSGLVDAMVHISDNKTKTGVSNRRTYTSPESNPRKFILSTGTYDVKVETIGKSGGQTRTFTITIEEGKIVEKIISF
ncbi:vWA domain-containing protein [Salmonirosea aquatica]